MTANANLDALGKLVLRLSVGVLTGAGGTFCAAPTERADRVLVMPPARAKPAAVGTRLAHSRRGRLQSLVASRAVGSPPRLRRRENP